MVLLAVLATAVITFCESLYLENGSEGSEVHVQNLHLNKRSTEENNLKEDKVEDMQPAETIVFRPFFYYRGRSANRRRLGRSVPDESASNSGDLKGSATVFRPFFRSRILRRQRL